MTAVHRLPRVSTLESTIISVLFWIGLGLAALISAALALSPRWLEVEILQLRYARNAVEISALQQETDHLARVSAALKSDPDFLMRVASSELGTLPAGGQRIPVEGALAYDARVPVVHQLALPEQAWYFPVLEAVATSSPLRWRLQLSALLLVLLTFFCLNDIFFGGGLQDLLAQLQQRWGRRYVPAPAEERSV